MVHTTISLTDESYAWEDDLRAGPRKANTQRDAAVFDHTCSVGRTKRFTSNIYHKLRTSFVAVHFGHCAVHILRVLLKCRHLSVNFCLSLIVIYWRVRAFNSPGRSPAAGGNPRDRGVHQLVLQRVQMRKAEGELRGAGAGDRQPAVVSEAGM